MIVADTSGLLALFNKREPAHERVVAYMNEQAQPLIVSPFVIAELDYLIATRLGVESELIVLRELASGAYDLPTLDAEDLALCSDVVESYQDQSIGVADASLVVLADRYRTKSVMTLDRRHFDVLRPLAGGRFELPIA